MGIRKTVTDLQGGLCLAVVQKFGSPSARLQDFYAVSVQARLCARTWFAGLIFVFVSANKNDPYLISLRGPGNIGLFVVSIVTFIALIRCGYWRGRGLAGKILEALP
jgi:hypothetical protein